MCGIVGFVGPGTEQIVLAMRDRLTHRGPDDAGHVHDHDVWLAHRRLSIIDLAGGAQPMMNERGDHVLVFNGEIYNHEALRESFGARTFRTRCDSETILRAYALHGTDAAAQLDGMFAFVIYDRSRRRLFGARDRAGKKPLCYTTRPFAHDLHPTAFAFASEIKSLRGHPAIRAAAGLSEEGLLSYLLMDYATNGRSCFDGIAHLPPGHAFTYDIDQRQFNTWTYWNLEASLIPHASVPTEEEAGRTIDELLTDAVGRRLMSDVPLGVLLSGGIDSSAVLAFMCRHRAANQIQTFSIGFDETSFDESSHASAIASHFGTRHHQRRFTADEMRRRLPTLIDLLDEPFADPSILPVALLCEFARQHVTVALGGDGGDELFAGYDPFLAVASAARYRRWVPPWCHDRLLVPAARHLPASDRNMSLGFRAERFLGGARAPAHLRCALWMSPFSVEQLRCMAPDLVGSASAESLYAQVLGRPRRDGPRLSEMQEAIYFFQRHYLPNDILTKVDRASMMHSLEVRCPFLDTAMIEYVNPLPDHYKLRHGRTKYILKQLLLGAYGHGTILPAEIVNRRKKGFGIPVARWIRHELRDTFRETLIDDWPTTLDGFDATTVRALFEAHASGQRNHCKELWALFVLAVWARRHLSS